MVCTQEKNPTDDQVRKNKNTVVRRTVTGGPLLQAETQETQDTKGNSICIRTMKSSPAKNDSEQSSVKTFR